MRTTGDDDLDIELLERLKSSQCNMWAFLYRWNGSTWDEVQDVDTKKGISWNKNSKKVKYANYAFLPEPSDISFSIINEKGKYSEGSGTAYEGWFDNDTKVKLIAGYLIETAYSTSSTVVPVGSFSDGGDGYYYYQISLDRLHKKWGSIKLTYSGDVELEYRLFRDPLHKDYYDTWTTVSESAETGRLVDDSGGALTDGSGYLIDTATDTITLDSGYKYIQVRIPSADLTDLTSVTFNVDDYFTPVYTDVFYLDTPTFTEPADPAIPKVECKGRDSFKYTINSEIQPWDYTGQTVDTMIKHVLDQCNVKYTASSISTFPTVAARDNDVNVDSPKSAQWFLEHFMQIITIDANYNVYMDYDSSEDDNIFYVQPKPDDYIADFVFDYRNYKSLGGRRKNHDSILKRITVQTEDQPIDEETILYTNTFTSNQTSLKVALGSDLNFYHRVELLGTGTLDDIKIENDEDLVQTYAYLTVTASVSDSLSVTIKGCSWTDDLPPNWSGEGLSANNVTFKKGNEVKILNPFLNASTEARAIAEYLIDENGTAIDEATGIQYPYNNLFLQVNDMTMLWSRWVFLDDLRYITGIKYRWQINNGNKHSASFNVSDSGLNFYDEYDFIYDETPPLDYDVGFIWDMGISTPQSTDAEIDAATVTYNNVSFS
jgi:hypothetical protein